MKEKTIMVSLIILMWIIIVPVAYFEGRIDPNSSYYTACSVEVLVWTIGMLTGYKLGGN